MKTKLVFITAFIFALTTSVFTQVKITPDKVIYQRTGKDVPDHKKSFEINYPKVSGMYDPTVKKNLEATLDYWKIFEMNLEEELGEFYGVDSADYEIGYNKNWILSIKLNMDVSGAYPSTMTKNLVVNLKNGKRVFYPDVFTNMKQLLLKVDTAKTANEKKAVAELKKDNAEDARALQDMLKNKNYQVGKLDEFSVSDKGVTFHYDYGFPHVVQALAPDGDYFFKWSELKPFIKRDGLLAKFIR